MLEKEYIEGLFRSNYAAMYRLARCILHDDEESKDVVSDVFERIAAGTVAQEPEKMSHYLLVSVRNRCYDVISRKQTLDKMKRLCPLDAVADLSPVAEEEARIESILQYAVDNLTPQTYKVFSMRFDDGKRYKEIAGTLGISIPAVYKHLSQALQKIRKQFKND